MMTVVKIMVEKKTVYFCFKHVFFFLQMFNTLSRLRDLTTILERFTKPSGVYLNLSSLIKEFRISSKINFKNIQSFCIH